MPETAHILITERLVLRTFSADDAPALEAVFCDPDVMQFSDGELDAAGVRAWLEAMIDEHYPDWGFGMWAVEETATGAAIGYCGLSRFPGRCAPDEAELGFRLIRSRWGHGFATEAARSVCRYGLRSLGRARIVATVDPGNAASLGVVEKIGMRQCGEVMFEGYTHPDLVYEIRPGDVTR